MQLRFKIDPDRITLDDIIVFEDAGAAHLVQLRDLLARHVVDESQAPLPEDAARKAVGALTLSELRGAARQFGQAIKDLAIPPASGSNS